MVASTANPTDIARETLKLLATRRLPPTPENFRRLYQEIAGQPEEEAGSEKALRRVVQALAEAGGARPAQVKQAEKALAERDWTGFALALEELMGALPHKEPEGSRWPELIPELLRQWEAKQSGLNSAKKKAALERVLVNFGADQAVLAEKLEALTKAWSEHRVAPVGVPVDEPAESAVSPAAFSGAAAGELREIVAQSLVMGVVPRISQFADLVEEATRLAETARAAASDEELSALSRALKQFWIKLAIRNESDAEVLEGLIRLLRLLVENIAELVAEDQWLHGQVAVVQELVTKPLDTRAIYEAEQSFKNVLMKQSTLKVSLNEAKATLKSMVTTFISRLGEMSASTDDYHGKISRYAEELGKTDDIHQINRLLGDLLSDTRGMQLDIQRSRDELDEARRRVEEAEERIRSLETELDEVSEMVRQDHLTGALNRRGMEDAFAREFARAERVASPLSVAIMDIDHFKRLNDTYGHDAGDNALVHLVNVVKDVIRPMDVVARFGGEEFVLLLPNTGTEEGVHVMTRVQRELTRRFFLHDNQKLLITFSAGVALWRVGESTEDVLARADRALYRAKEAGRNRVLSAED